MSSLRLALRLSMQDSSGPPPSSSSTKRGDGNGGTGEVSSESGSSRKRKSEKDTSGGGKDARNKEREHGKRDERSREKENDRKKDRPDQHDRQERTEKTDRSERTEKAEKVDRSERTDKADRSERIEKAKKADRSERAEKMEKADRSEKMEKADRSERTEKAEKADRSEGVEKPDRSERVEKADRSERVEKTEKADRSERIEKAERADRSEGVEKPDRSERVQKADRSERVEKTDRDREREVRTERQDKKEKTRVDRDRTSTKDDRRRTIRVLESDEEAELDGPVSVVPKKEKSRKREESSTVTSVSPSTTVSSPSPDGLEAAVKISKEEAVSESPATSEELSSVVADKETSELDGTGQESPLTQNKNRDLSNETTTLTPEVVSSPKKTSGVKTLDVFTEDTKNLSDKSDSGMKEVIVSSFIAETSIVEPDFSADTAETVVIKDEEVVNEKMEQDDMGLSEVDIPRKKKKRVRDETSDEVRRDSFPIDGDETVEGENKRFKSSRAAAVVAKTKLVTNPTVKGEGDRRKSLEPEKVWVQCNACQKWRTLPPTILLGDLPDIWYCRQSTWSNVYNRCSAPQEKEDDVVSDGDDADHQARRDKKRRRQEDAEGRGVPQDGNQRRDREGRRERGDSNRRDGRVKDELSTVAATGEEEQVTRRTTRGNRLNAAVSADNWVQCNKCSRWRKVPVDINVSSLPELWYCSLNTWNAAVARCNAKEETDAAENTGPARETRARRQATTATPATTVSDGSDIAAAYAAATGAVPAVKKTNWVQCERKSCQKWRKVPLSIPIESLPNRWYCEMNTWNPLAASCDVAADEASDDEGTAAATDGKKRRNAPLLEANAKHGGVGYSLSYRKIIFSADGRIRPCFMEKNKNGVGIFTTHHPRRGGGLVTVSSGSTIGGVGEANLDESTDVHRQVAYWWSSAYEEWNAPPSITTGAGGNRRRQQQQEEPVSTEPPFRFPTSTATDLLDAARRIAGGTELPLRQFGEMRKLSRGWRVLDTMSLFERQYFECVAVRSTFLAAGGGHMPLIRLQQLLTTYRFVCPRVDACRSSLTVESLKAALRRMELAGECEVNLSKDGQWVITMLMSLSRLRDELILRSKNFDAPKSPCDEKYGVARNLPLKMRKFVSNPTAPTMSEATTPPTVNTEMTIPFIQEPISTDTSSEPSPNVAPTVAL